MNRRQFLGASLSTTIASAALPWDPFVQWFKAWFGEVKRKGAGTLVSFNEMLKRLYPKETVERIAFGPYSMTRIEQHSLTVTL